MSRQEVNLETTIDAPVERVWKVVCDPRRFPEWMSNVQKVRVEGDGTLKKGSKFTVETKLGSHVLSSHVQVTHCTKPEILGWRHLEDTLDGESMDMVKDGETQMVLDEKGEQTHVRGLIAFTPVGLKAKLGAAFFLNTKLKPQLQQSLERLKRLVAKEK